MSKSEVTAAGTFAPLRNVILVQRLVDHLINRAPNLPGMGVFSGPSGFGKTVASSYIANRHRAVYVECRSYFSQKSLLLTILLEMGVKPGRTVFEMVHQIGEQLALSKKPLVLDQADYLVEKRPLVELVRDIHDASNAAVLLIGEENFPKQLKRYERFHNRVLDWQLAEPSDLEDAKKLAKLYSSDVEIGADLLDRIVEVTHGVTRRVCVNIEMVRSEAKKASRKDGINLKDWGNRGFYTGEAPQRRPS